ncbi:Asp23/Gls24 family envelope stress response protein [Aliicoccus persicus]|uniref:Asp23/Gls24 family envelope stress response protein n=1 Tax=Aliicoccus persicus TaxID=930138 RepID=A0A662Z0B0_9STAP|nr:Asp23/Gls24 family envelope stress response protein [Aliicoccus persicus]SEV81225.1 Uncharacterized conserved protein YloU, alkaline shock protein (Asp23) family [Aliicoccus persicus]HJE19313.1 Asp23/Gls24 family envelope stress response protein [Aliicoccus persicus]
MTLEIKNEFGSIGISEDVIATLAGSTAVESYGIVGMASKSQVRDGVSELLGIENYSRGVVVELKDDQLTIDLFIIVGYGVKISEVASNIQGAVKYKLENTLGLEISAVNIHVQGVRIINNESE